MNDGKLKLAKMIDHTLLRPEATRDEVVRICEEGEHYGFASVCINPVWVSLASRLLRGSKVKVDTVIGFPFGATISDVKIFETKMVISKGAEEVDVVMNFGALRSGDIELIRKELESIIDLAKGYGVISKVIIETCYLTREEKIRACRLIMDSGADFVKTSTGFGKGGAVEEDVKLFSKITRNKIGIKASGGIRTYEDALKMIKAGASRIGSSSGVDIVETELKKRIL